MKKLTKKYVSGKCPVCGEIDTIKISTDLNEDLFFNRCDECGRALIFHIRYIKVGHLNMGDYSVTLYKAKTDRVELELE